MDTQESPAVVIFEGEELSLNIGVIRYEFSTATGGDDANWLVAHAVVIIDDQEFGYRIFLEPRDFMKLSNGISLLQKGEVNEARMAPLEDQLVFKITLRPDDNFDLRGELRHGSKIADFAFGCVITPSKLWQALDQVDHLLQRFPEREEVK